MAKDKAMQSANFKKDYVTALAVGLFFLMVLSELFVAISIPITIKHTELYADAGTRQKMNSSFDSLRSQCSANSKNPIVNMEKRLIRWDLDLLSSHLREYNTDMPMSDVENVLQDIRQYNTIMLRLSAKEPLPYCSSTSLDLTSIADKIEKQLESSAGL